MVIDFYTKRDNGCTGFVSSYYYDNDKRLLTIGDVQNNTKPVIK